MEISTPSGKLVPITPSEAVALGTTSLEAYGKLWFPRTYRQASPQFHIEIGDALYSNARQIAVEVFRGGAKTSLLRVFTSQRIAYAISRTIMYVSVSQAHAIFSLRWIKRQIEYNKAWAQMFQLRKGNTWTNEVLEIYHGVDETPITILAMGITGQIRGFNLDDYRPDLIIADDILNEENTATLEQRKKIEDLFFGALANSLAPASDSPDAKIVLLQTPLNKLDIVETCMKDASWHGMRFSCFDSNGDSRWEVRYPKADLLAQKESAIKMGRFGTWMREMECSLATSDRKAFDIENLQHWDVLPSNIEVIMSIDPASSDNIKADDNVVMVVGQWQNNIYVLEYSAEIGEMPDLTANHFFEFILKWRPLRCIVEIVSFQRVLKWYLEQEMKKRRVFVTTLSVQDRRRKADRILQALSGVVAYRNLYIKASMQKLIDQLNDFDPQVDGKDDVLDALAMAIVGLRPYLRDDEDTLEGTAREVDDEDEDYYERGAP